MALIRNTSNFINGEIDDRGYAWSMRNRSDFVSGVQRKVGMYNDPTYLGFILLFQPNSPLLSIIDTPGTAYHYLLKIGEKTRAQELQLLSDSIRDLNHNMPWYWQSIEGLETAYKFGNMKDPYRGGDDAKITINALESIDLRITQIVELYRHIVYDIHHRREIVPENLRKFRLWIWIQEMRKFQIDDIAFGKTGADTSKIVNENSPWLLFQLDYCEFLTDESNPYLSSLSFAEANPASNKLVIQYDNIYYENGLNFAELYARLNQLDTKDSLVNKFKRKNESPLDGPITPKNSKFGDIADKIESTLTNSVENLAAQSLNNAQNIIEGFATGLFLGNVHGFSASGAIDTIKQASALSAIGRLGNIGN